MRVVRLLDWNQNKRKVDADFQAAREEQNWHLGLSAHSNLDSKFLRKFPDVYSLIYIFSG